MQGENFVFGGENLHGFLQRDFARIKIQCEMKDQNIDVYLGFYSTYYLHKLVSNISTKGILENIEHQAILLLGCVRDILFSINFVVMFYVNPNGFSKV